MNTKLVLKGILLYATFAMCVLIVAGADSLYDNGQFVQALSVSIGLVLLCKKIITKQEYDKLT